MKQVLVFVICAGFVIEKDIPKIKSVTPLPEGLLVEWIWKGDADDIDGFKVSLYVVM